MVDWEVFKTGAPAEVAAEIEKLPKRLRYLPTGLETLGTAVYGEAFKCSSTPLTHAASNNANAEVVSVLIKAGADLEARDEKGGTPLMRAAGSNSNPEVVLVLLKAGAELEARDEDGWTPLMLAARYNTNPEVVSALIKAGANVKATMGKFIFRQTVLELAKENENIYKTDAYWELNDAFHNQQ